MAPDTDTAAHPKPARSRGGDLVRLPEADRDALAALLRAEGAVQPSAGALRVARRFKAAPLTLALAALGLPVRRGTALLIREELTKGTT